MPPGQVEILSTIAGTVKEDELVKSPINCRGKTVIQQLMKLNGRLSRLFCETDEEAELRNRTDAGLDISRGEMGC